MRTRSALLLVTVLPALALSACDSDGGADNSFFRLQDTWERTDAGFTGESVQFGPGQRYTFRDGDTVVESGDYTTLSEGNPFRVRYGALNGRPDEEATLTDDTLVLTPPDGGARSYRRD